MVILWKKIKDGEKKMVISPRRPEEIVRKTRTNRIYDVIRV